MVEKKSPLYWLGPELARAGYLFNEDWVEPTVKRAIALFPNQALHPAAALLSALDRRAIDYIEQAPVLAMAATYGLKCSHKQERMFIAMNFGPLAKGGRKLRDVMATYHVAYQLRALSANALRPGIWPLLQAISKHVDPSTIAQAIPDNPKKHYYWLGDLSNLWVVLDRRAPNIAMRAAILRWAMFALARAKPASDPEAAAGAADIADFLIAEYGRFNPRWTWERVVAESRDWHEAIANAKVDSYDNPAYDVEVDYGPFPVEQRIGDFDFVALRSLRSLIVEGKAMHHCVSSYYRDVARGLCRIYSIRRDGKRVATAEFQIYPDVRAAQIKAACNLEPSKDITRAAQGFATALRAGTKPRGWIGEA